MEGSVWWDYVSCAGSTVGVVGWTDELSLLALLELADALVPTADYLADTDLKLKWNATRDRAVKNATVWELSNVVDFDQCASWDNFTRTVV